MSLSHPGSRVRRRMGLGETDRVRSDRVEVVFCGCYLVILFLSLSSGVVCRFLVRLAVLRSNIHSRDPILWSVLFQTTPFWHSFICQSLFITRPHPPPVFIAPRDFRSRKMRFFMPKLPFFGDFRRFFAHNKIKYEPISKRFSFSDSLRIALQHCRSKFVATQTS